MRSGILLVAVIAGALSPIAELQAFRAQTREQFACYPAQFSTFAPRTITISDAVVTKLTITVRRPVDVCPPARVGAVRAADASLYLACSEISSPPVRRRSPGRVSTPLGSGKLTIEGARSTCVSASRAARAPASLLLTCYGVVAPAADERRESTIADTFATSRDQVAAGRPVLFCTESRRGPSALHLVCYPVESKTRGRTLVLTTAWGVLRASPGIRDRLCVRASLAP